MPRWPRPAGVDHRRQGSVTARRVAGAAPAAPMSFLRNPFWRSVTVVLTGTAAAQAIPLVGALVLARLFAPAEYGLFAIWLGVAALGAVVLTGRYEVALAIEHDGARRQVGVLATLLVVAAVAVPLFLVSLVVAWLNLLPDFDAALIVVAVPAAAAMAASQTWQAWAAADGQYRDLAKMRIGAALAITVAQIVSGVLKPSAANLALAHLGGVLVGLAIAGWCMPMRWPGVSRAALLEAVRAYHRRHRRFPLLSLPADGINTAAAQLPLLIVGSRFGADIAGLLAMTLRMVGAPIGLLGSAVLDVFRRRSAGSYRARGECRAEYLETFKALSLGAAVTAVILIWAAEPLFVLAFGERWRLSGTMAAWLMPMFALRFVASPLSYMFYVAGKQHLDLVWQSGLLVMTLATLSLPSDHAPALKLYSAGYAGMYGIYLLMSYRFSKGAQV